MSSQYHSRHKLTRVALLAGMAAMLSTVPAATARTQQAANQASIATRTAYPPYSGPRKTIAVSKFDAIGAFVASYGGWDLGGGLAAMLSAELADTNRFILVERSDVDTLLREKQMALSDVTFGGSGAPLLGAQLFIRGSVTEFDQQTKGGGFSLGFGTGGLLGGLGSRSSSGSVAITLQMIDAGTGAVVGSYRVQRKISESSLALRVSARGLSSGVDGFSQTPLGRAMRGAIGEAVSAIIADMERVPWQGLIASVEGRRVTVNAGRNANLAVGARLRAVRSERVITDPATGQILGTEQRTIGDLVIEAVEDRYAVGRWVSSEAPQRGDVVQFLQS